LCATLLAAVIGARQNRRFARNCARHQMKKIAVSGAETVPATGTIRPCG
jgi:hypothetical protein